MGLSKVRPWLVLVLFAVTPQVAGGFNRGEVECEEAVAHISRCCPQLAAPAYSCDHYTGCGATQLPEIQGADSICVRSLSCEEIIEDGWCAADGLVQGRCS